MHECLKVFIEMGRAVIVVSICL